MDLRLLIFPLLVFLGGCCYGPSSPVIKLAYAAGFSWQDLVMSQYFYGWLILSVIIAGFYLFRRVRNQPLPKTGDPRPLFRRIPGVFLAGACIGLVTVTYCLSLQTVPAYISVILLFQFTWMGVLIQAVAERRLPQPKIVISVILLVIGTFLAAGFAGLEGPLDPAGVIFGLLSALLYALYMFLLGRVEIGMHPLNRSFLIISSSLVMMMFLFTPRYFTEGIFASGIWQYGVILGSIGCVVPMFLFAIAAPRIPTGMTTILSSSELPASIICAVIILGESVSWIQYAGILLLFIGIAYPQYHPLTWQKHMRKGAGMHVFLHPHIRLKKIR
ncbi:MAG: DMT family transporter [Methanocorpusculum sp.]|nr:DMT family transporter [Methanocorpusculum sp.]MDD3912711.1 DMT family transporter [Methanocorpusculum sp.]